MVGAVGVGQHGRGHDVGDLPADAAGQVVGERHPGRLERDGDRQRAGLGDRHQRRVDDDAGEQRLGLGLQVLQESGAVARRAVVEDHVGLQRDGPGRVGRVRHHRLGQVGRPPALRRDDGQRVEDRAGVHDAHLVEAGRRGQEARLLGVDAEHERTALLGGLLRDAVAPRAVRDGAGDPVPPQVERGRAPANPAAAAAPPASSARRSNLETIDPPLSRTQRTPRRFPWDVSSLDRPIAGSTVAPCPRNGISPASTPG